mgnify:FL=1|jgi:hypothetical protein
MNRWLIGSFAIVALAPSALAQAEPLPDVPREHPASWAVATLWRADVIRGSNDGLFHGDERISKLEAIALAARLSAALNNVAVIRADWSMDRYLARFWHEEYPARGGVPLPAGHWAALEWSYLARITPAEVELLDAWPEPLPTRYEAAIAAATVLREARKAIRGRLVSDYAGGMLPDSAVNDTMPMDYVPWSDHGSGHGPDHGPAAPMQGVIPFGPPPSMAAPE